MVGRRSGTQAAKDSREAEAVGFPLSSKINVSQSADSKGEKLQMGLEEVKAFADSRKSGRVREVVLVGFWTLVSG